MFTCTDVRSVLIIRYILKTRVEAVTPDWVQMLSSFLASCPVNVIYSSRHTAADTEQPEPVALLFGTYLKQQEQRILEKLGF